MPPLLPTSKMPRMLGWEKCGDRLGHALEPRQCRRVLGQMRRQHLHGNVQHAPGRHPACLAAPEKIIAVDDSLP